MRKIVYPGICMFFVLAFFADRATAQYHIATHIINASPDTICFGPQMTVTTNSFAPTLKLRTYFGDGTSQLDTLFNSGGIGYSYISHNYTSAGTYTVKHVLYNSTSPIDSVTDIFNYQYCNTFIISAFQDANSNCIYDSATESYIYLPMTVEVDSSGVPIDTLVTSSGFYYTVYGSPGTVYRFKVLSISGGAAVTCPATGIIYDTISTIVNNYIEKSFAVNCLSTGGFDIMEYVITRAGRHHYQASIMVLNSNCTPQNVTLTAHFSPRYAYQIASPAPASISGTTVVWNLTGVSSIHPVYITLNAEVPGTWLLAGDTVHSDFSITPPTGDGDPTNNYVAMIDTVTSSFDPNAKEVYPQGNIHAGDKLTYTIHFENTGNDTAFNIHVMDTLSSNLDERSVAIVSATAPMFYSLIKNGGYNIAKFDFPNINLLDSTHTGSNTGMFVFTVNSKTGLASGTAIDNRAGIYFDFNSVVMTNTVENKIGTPASTTIMSNVNKVNVYPNPVNGILTINTGNEIYYALNIINTIGQLMITQELNGRQQAQVDVSALPAGIYFMSLRGMKDVKVVEFEKR